MSVPPNIHRFAVKFYTCYVLSGKETKVLYTIFEFVFKVLNKFLFYSLTLDDGNSLNAELNPICHMLALLGSHHILHVSRIRVNVYLKRPAEFF